MNRSILMEQNKKKIVWDNNSFFKNVEEMLKEGKQVKITVKGRSMSPALEEGDVVLLEAEKRTRKQKKEDIVLAKYEGKYILHRIVWVTGKHSYLAGDGNNSQIEKVRKEDVIALVKEASRGDENLALNSSTNSTRCLRRTVWYVINSIKKRFL